MSFFQPPDQEIHSVAMTCFEKLLRKYFAIEIAALMETGSRVYEKEKRADGSSVRHWARSVYHPSYE